MYMEYGNHWSRLEDNPQLAEMILRSDYKNKKGQYVFTSFSAVLKCGDQNREQNVRCSNWITLVFWMPKNSGLKKKFWRLYLSPSSHENRRGTSYTGGPIREGQETNLVSKILWLFFGLKQ